MNTPAATRPPSALIAAVRRHPLASFFILTFLFSWGMRVPTIFLSWWPAPISFMAMFGPAFAAVAVLLLTGEQQKAASLFRSLFRWKMHPGWYSGGAAPAARADPRARSGQPAAVAAPRRVLSARCRCCQC